MEMLKNALIRGINGFVYAIATNVILALIIIIMAKEPNFVPLVPDYAARFDSEIIALLLQTVLIGLTSAAFGAGSVILEIGHWSLLKQSIIYFIVTTVFWLPVSMFCWGINKYPTAFISVICSYIASYVITWVIQYSSCKKSVAKINQKLLQMNENETEQ
jgi:glucan phosphoethanolaminetransferase (alkaline phosphatase superfamily)